MRYLLLLLLYFPLNLQANDKNYISEYIGLWEIRESKVGSSVKAIAEDGNKKIEIVKTEQSTQIKLIIPNFKSFDYNNKGFEVRTNAYGSYIITKFEHPNRRLFIFEDPLALKLIFLKFIENEIQSDANEKSFDFHYKTWFMYGDLDDRYDSARFSTKHFSKVLQKLKIEKPD